MKNFIYGFVNCSIIIILTLLILSLCDVYIFKDKEVMEKHLVAFVAIVMVVEVIGDFCFNCGFAYTHLMENPISQILNFEF